MRKMLCVVMSSWLLGNSAYTVVLDNGLISTYLKGTKGHIKATPTLDLRMYLFKCCIMSLVAPLSDSTHNLPRPT